MSKERLHACPKCTCTDLEGSPFPADRLGNWKITCGDPSCSMFLVSADKDMLVLAWNLLYINKQQSEHNYD